MVDQDYHHEAKFQGPVVGAFGETSYDVYIIAKAVADKAGRKVGGCAL